ncbi:unnamed protein product [Thelazia callipaeda]|uniref:Bestrophin homolog n=1 Tax=Thelazia callipaeda TaxID=103827 RepID=A0A0N5D6J1_THECL|nr:unnamed protein product [Thelazia callipaeda]
MLVKFLVQRHGTKNTCLQLLSRKVHDFSVITPVLYAETCYFTKTLQFAIEGLQAAGIPWVGTFMLSGALFRIASLPLHIYAERLSAERFHVVNTLNYELMKKFSKHYKLNIVSSENGRFLKLDTTDKSILQETNKLVEVLLKMCRSRGLQLQRIQYLRLCAVSVWTFSSFAIRNVITSGVGRSYEGALWFSDLLQPDPYYIIPVFVGILGFFNYFQRVYGFSSRKVRQVINDCGVLILQCIPLFWSTVSLTGCIQHFAFRHPKIKKLLGVRPLPSDSCTPIRAFFFK